MTRPHIPFLIMAALLIPTLWSGCTLIFHGILKNETGDTARLAAIGYHHHPEYLCGCPISVDTLHRTATIDLPPDSSIVIGIRAEPYAEVRTFGRYHPRFSTFDSVRITGRHYAERTFSDSTITLLPSTIDGRRQTFRLLREP